jgi:hypothetical protein
VTLTPYPDDTDLRDLAEAHERLRTQGIEPGPDGYSMDALAAATYARGFMYRIDRATGIGGYRVELRLQRGAATQPFVAGVGWEPGVALAFALDQALLRLGREHNSGTGEPSDQEAAARAR